MGIEYIGDKEKRNSPCTCGSGLKYKKCHGDPAKLAVVKHIANEAMLIMIAWAKLEDLSMGFNCEDYGKVLDNPDLVLPRFYKQFILREPLECSGETN